MRLRGTNQEFGRPYNRRIVLETIREKAPISRADIAREVALSTQTVSNIIRELEAANLLVAAREEPRRRGQPATMLSLNPEGGFAIGLQLAPGSLRAVLVNLVGETVARRQAALRDMRAATIFRAAGDVVRGFRKARPAARLLGIGLAMPGPFGVVPMSFVGSTTIESLKGVSVRGELAARTGLPVFIDVDAATSAQAERLFGAGRRLRDFFHLYFGIGLGGCQVHDGQLQRGAHGNAGEIGHLPLGPDSEECPCGNRGCLERTLSLDALHRRLKARRIDPATADLARLTAEHHPVVEAWLEAATPLFQRTLVAIENLFDPSAVIVGGILPEPLLDRLVRAASPLLPSVAERFRRTGPRLIRSELGADAALRGAALLAISGMLSPRFGQLFAEPPVRPASADPIIAGSGSGDRTLTGVPS
jgi:predicted NBD/HSP70 family sugar kinase